MPGSNASTTATDTSASESDTFLLGLIAAGTVLFLGGIFYQRITKMAYSSSHDIPPHQVNYLLFNKSLAPETWEQLAGEAVKQASSGQ